MNTIKEIVKQDVKDSCEGYVEDLLQHGCVSGMVSRLIYYSDTIKFYDDHIEEINELLKDTLDSTGLSITELFGDKFDNEDPLVQDTNNKNLLAWFAYEETARNLYEFV